MLLRVSIIHAGSAVMVGFHAARGEVNVAYYSDTSLLKQLLPDICQAASDFCITAHHVTCAQEHRAAATKDSGLHSRRGLPTDQTSVL